MPQCKDIPDTPILAFILSHDPAVCFSYTSENPDDINPRGVARAMPAGTPQNLVWAKMRSLIARKLVNGCGCGCRGDFTITDKGRAELGRAQGSVQH